MANPRSPIPQGTLDLMVLKTLEQLGPLHGYDIARRIEQVGQEAVIGILGALLLGVYLPIEEMGGWKVPGVLPGAAAFMTLVGLLAAAGPARRGLRIDPTEALRDG